MFFSYEDGQKIFLIIFSSPQGRRIKVLNLTSGWVQYRSRRETGDSRAVTSIQERKSRDFSTPQLFHSKHSIFSFMFRPQQFSPFARVKQLRNREITRQAFMY